MAEIHGDKYTPIDLVDNFSIDKTWTPFSVLKSEAVEWKFVVIHHSNWQHAVVFPKRSQRDYAEDVKHIVDKN